MRSSQNPRLSQPRGQLPFWKTRTMSFPGSKIIAGCLQLRCPIPDQSGLCPWLPSCSSPSPYGKLQAAKGIETQACSALHILVGPIGYGRVRGSTSRILSLISFFTSFWAIEILVACPYHQRPFPDQASGNSQPHNLLYLFCGRCDS